jgi:hypothetical protein
MNPYYAMRYRLGRLKKAVVEASYFSAYKAGLLQPRNDSLARLGSYHGKFKGRRCFVVGNAPSLNQLDLSNLRGEYCFVFNGAFDIADTVGKDTCFHAVEDRLVFEDHRQRLNMLEHEAFYPSDLDHLVTSERPIVCPFSRAWPEWATSWPPRLDVGANRPVFYWGGTVAVFGLQLALWMGFSEIYIIGVDLDYKIPQTVIQKGAVLTSTADDPNHYRSSYFGAGLRWHVPRPERMMRAFERYAEVAFSDTRIFNAGKGGKLECFPRCTFESLFPK